MKNWVAVMCLAIVASAAGQTILNGGVRLGADLLKSGINLGASTVGGIARAGASAAETAGRAAVSGVEIAKDTIGGASGGLQINLGGSSGTRRTSNHTLSTVSYNVHGGSNGERGGNSPSGVSLSGSSGRLGNAITLGSSGGGLNHREIGERDQGGNGATILNLNRVNTDSGRAGNGGIIVGLQPQGDAGSRRELGSGLNLDLTGGNRVGNGRLIFEQGGPGSIERLGGISGRGGGNGGGESGFSVGFGNRVEPNRLGARLETSLNAGLNGDAGRLAPLWVSEGNNGGGLNIGNRHGVTLNSGSQVPGERSVEWIRDNGVGTGINIIPNREGNSFEWNQNERQDNPARLGSRFIVESEDDVRRNGNSDGRYVFIPNGGSDEARLYRRPVEWSRDGDRRGGDSGVGLGFDYGRILEGTGGNLGSRLNGLSQADLGRLGALGSGLEGLSGRFSGQGDGENGLNYGRIIDDVRRNGGNLGSRLSEADLGRLGLALNGEGGRLATSLGGAALDLGGRLGASGGSGGGLSLGTSGGLGRLGLGARLGNSLGANSGASVGLTSLGNLGARLGTPLGGSSGASVGATNLGSLGARLGNPLGVSTGASIGLPTLGNRLAFNLGS